MVLWDAGDMGGALGLEFQNLGSWGFKGPASLRAYQARD